MIDLAFDDLVGPARGYPNLALIRPRPYTEQWRQFDRHWPFTIPLRFMLFCDHAGLPYRVWQVAQAPAKSWYPICFSWFDFNQNYIDLIPATTLARIRDGDIKILFYYHEGDNPQKTLAALESQLNGKGLDAGHMILISANSAAASLPRSVYFDDSELWFWVLNKDQSTEPVDRCPPYDFTALSRTNKSWRACVMHDLWIQGCLDNSLWSYDSTMVMQDHPRDNPIQCGERWTSIESFLSKGPYRCDDLNSDQQNDHHWVNQALYRQSRIQLILETHFDADQSGGSLLSEKTYKCIKFGQPFVIIGAAATLSVLRSHGYRVFDRVIDNTYDLETDNTSRWQLLLREIRRLRSCSADVWAACQADVAHNQALFERRLSLSVNNLIEEIQCHW